MPPRRVGPYTIVSVIGRGGVGTVYRARHEASGQLAAVKVLGPAPAVDATAARRLAREYDVLRGLDHPYVVRVYDAGVSEGYSFLAMELVEGLDLRAYLSPVIDDEDLVPVPIDDSPYLMSPRSPSGVEAGADAIRTLAAMMDEPDTEPHAVAWAPALSTTPPLSPTRSLLAPEVREALNRPSRMERLRVALGQVADALAYVHQRGLVHRDIKPSNIMVDDLRRARLMDFGLVKAAHEGQDALTQAGRVVGTYRYMSPEQAQGHAVDARSDLYSVGVILYELLTGAPPYVTSDPVALWREILTCRPPPIASSNPGADTRLAQLAERLLEKDPDRRPQTAEELGSALAP